MGAIKASTHGLLPEFALWEKNPIIELSMSADIKERDVPFTQATEEASGKKLKDKGPEKKF